MIKHILPESFDFGVPSVEIIGCGRNGLDKQAMCKRASVDPFEDVIADLKPMKKRAYLHVITTGAQETYNANRNGDDFPETYQHVVFPYPEDPHRKSYDTDGGLKKYHNASYMSKKAAVYQEHHTKDTSPSGEIIAARYNDDMHRGELIIAVDTDKWADRLHKKASGQNIYLSMGCVVEKDTCFPKGTLVLTPDGYKCIESVREDDIVIAGESGAPEKVEACFIASTTKLTRVHTKGLPLPIESTPNHPYLCVPGNVVYNCWGSVQHKGAVISRRHTLNADGTCVTCGRHIELQHVWKQASELQEHDYLVVKLSSNAEHDTVGTSFAYLCGHYVGNGNLMHTANGHDGHGVQGVIGLTITASAQEKDRAIIERLCDLYRGVTGKEAATRAYKDKNAFNIDMHDKLLAVRIQELVGAGSRTKFIGSAIESWSMQEKLAFLGGYIDADGSLDEKQHLVRINTVNRGLALSVVRLCWSVGIRASIHMSSSAENMRKNAFGSTGPCYAVALWHAQKLLKPYAVKLRNEPDTDKHTAHKSNVIIANGFAYIPVDKVVTFDCDPVAVYNMQVSNDHTYNAEGVVVHNCRACGRMAKTAADHCDHFKRMRCQILDDGTQCSVINDAPKFYDISGVDVPADRIAFVLRKVASGDMAKTASYEALETYGARTPMLFTKAASTLRKLSKLEKRVEAFIEGDKDARQAPEFMDDDDTQRIFILKVRNHPCDEIIDSCNRKGILLSPGMLFKLLGKDMENPEDRENLCSLDDDSCGDCTHMLRELEEDEDCNVELQDGSFDQHFIPDVRLENILEAFMPLLGMTNPAVGARSIRITIVGSPRGMRQRKTAAAVNPEAQAALRRTYARYFISFAAQNDEATCLNALRKIATYGK